VGSDSKNGVRHQRAMSPRLSMMMMMMIVMMIMMFYMLLLLKRNNELSYFKSVSFCFLFYFVGCIAKNAV